MADVSARYTEVAEHVTACDEEKQVRSRTGPCVTINDDGTPCGATVDYKQTECPHAVLIVGTCENCGTNYDRAGWTNRPETQEA